MKGLKEKYQSEVVPKIVSLLGLDNSLSAPKITKVVVSTGVGKIKDKPKEIGEIEKILSQITGQKPSYRLSQKAISGFKLKKGEKIGLVVTLRGKRMFDFLGKLINIALPRIRDFRGLSASGFDGKGNYNLGLKEETSFPEIKVEENPLIFGLNITIVTNARNDQGAKVLLEGLGFPFARNEKWLEKL